MITKNLQLRVHNLYKRLTKDKIALDDLDNDAHGLHWHIHDSYKMIVIRLNKYVGHGG